MDIGTAYPPKEMDVVELKLGDYYGLDTYNKNKAKLKKQLKDFEVIVHAPYQYDLASPTKRQRKAAVKMYKKCVDLCSTFDAKIHVVHPSAWNVQSFDYQGTDRKKILDLIRESVPQIVDHAKSQGVTTALENLPTVYGMETKCVGHDPLEFTKLVKEFKCKMCFDIGHAIHDIDGFMKHKELFSHLHICDMTHDLKREHLVPGHGEIDWVKHTPTLLSMDLPSIFEFDRRVYKDKEFVNAKHWMKRLKKPRPRRVA